MLNFVIFFDRNIKDLFPLTNAVFLYSVRKLELKFGSNLCGLQDKLNYKLAIPNYVEFLFLTTVHILCD